MKTLQFRNGDKMPAFGLGTWKSQPGEVYAAVKEAIKTGYRHIDCAPIYGNEKEVGDALVECFDEGIVKREDLWITSKLWNDAHGTEDVEPALKKTLADLQVEYLDLFLIHWPVALKKGVSMAEKASDFFSLNEIPLSVTWRAMEAVQEKGLTTHIGVSNFSIDKLKSLSVECKIKPEMNQIEMHPYLQQQEMVDFCKEEGILLTAYSPLGSKDRPALLKADDEPLLLEDPTITRIAQDNGITPAQVLIAWSLSRNIAVIPKSVSPDRIRQNYKAAAIELGPQEMEEIAELDRGLRYVTGNFWVVDEGPYTLENLWD
ncbi:aldo/keto reductase [Fulvivirga sp. 29W222]|uniref:Aldo/keto reductase n=1 Tax=Fulvivirga marina TaxID=2494733 RepID=A0A937KBX4_9BACT|nr:aldo/keto reductase [Fulvivirga marina]MBL6447511.1 aldo/keto reductase [Fulvivirga marina]